MAPQPPSLMMRALMMAPDRRLSISLACCVVQLEGDPWPGRRFALHCCAEQPPRSAVLLVLLSTGRGRPRVLDDGVGDLSTGIEPDRRCSAARHLGSLDVLD